MPITTGRRKLQTIVKIYDFENMRAVEARSPFEGNQGRAHEVQDLGRNGQKNTNHDGRRRVHKQSQKSGVFKKCTPSRRETHWVLLVVCLGSPADLSCPPGPILESVFLLLHLVVIHTANNFPMPPPIITPERTFIILLSSALD